MTVFGSRLTGRQLFGNNIITSLINGEGAYPEMLAEIAQAKSSVALSTYQFDDDATGRAFIDTLSSAVSRGVEVRVLLDWFGTLISSHLVAQELRRRGVRTALFLPIRQPTLWAHLNLRYHRKLLVIDGRVGFTGGMNIRHRHVISQSKYKTTEDIHFRMEGPLVTEMQNEFKHDWKFVTGEVLAGNIWLPPVKLATEGAMLARGVPSGPDEDLETIRWLIAGAISSARRSIKIVTPYFLPDELLSSTLAIAAMKGVEISIITPVINMPIVKWATATLLIELIEKGCHAYLAPPPFDHSKLVVIDDFWSLIGSANWDSRSLRLNFEYAVEVYDKSFAEKIGDIIDAKISRSSRVDPAALRNGSLFAEIRNRYARLLVPYL